MYRNDLGSRKFKLVKMYKKMKFKNFPSKKIKNNIKSNLSDHCEIFPAYKYILYRRFLNETIKSIAR